MFDIMDKKFLFKEYGFEQSYDKTNGIENLYIEKLKFVSLNESYEHNLKPVKLVEQIQEFIFLIQC